MSIMYGLIHNGQIKVGPRTWLKSAFVEYLNEEGISFDTNELPLRNPDTVFSLVKSDWKILPVGKIDETPYDSLFEQPAGPFWTIKEDHIVGFMDKADKSVEMTKGHMRELLAYNRWKAETSGITVNVQGTDVFVDTSREGRQIFFDTYLSMSENDTTVWKFPQAWLTLTKNELGYIVTQGKNHIQNCFEWEKNTLELIENAATLNDLKIISLIYSLTYTV